ncbi:MAG: DUF4118 domain-containing protein, partial [Burkholderiales bacterium]|nr:DUF4118 domain-containing protein [Anaerolineae bacterium]
MASSQIQRPDRWWHRWSGLLVTLAVVLVVFVLALLGEHIGNPTGIYLIAVVYAAFSGGRRIGLVSALLVFIAACIHFSWPDLAAVPLAFAWYSSGDVERMVILAFSSTIVALLVGLLKERTDQYLQVQQSKEALEAEMSQRQLVASEKDALSSQIQEQRERLNSIIASVPGVVFEAWG